MSQNVVEALDVIAGIWTTKHLSTGTMDRVRSSGGCGLGAGAGLV